MARPTDDAQDREREARAVRRLLRSFRLTESYGLLLLMIIVPGLLAFLGAWRTKSRGPKPVAPPQVE